MKRLLPNSPEKAWEGSACCILRCVESSSRIRRHLVLMYGQCHTHPPNELALSRAAKTMVHTQAAGGSGQHEYVFSCSFTLLPTTNMFAQTATLQNYATPATVKTATDIAGQKLLSPTGRGDASSHMPGHYPGYYCCGLHQGNRPQQAVLPVAPSSITEGANVRMSLGPSSRTTQLIPTPLQPLP